MSEATCTDEEFIKLYTELGSRGTSDYLGLRSRSVRARRQRIEERLGHPITRKVPEGHEIKGKSTLYDLDGNTVLEWIKTGINKEETQDIYDEIIEGLKDRITPQKPIKAGKNYEANLLTLYPVGDHHFGMLAWDEETGGENYDLTIAEKLLLDATLHLVDKTPNSEEAAVLVLGDFLHYDGFTPVTPLNKNVLDADSRFPKMVRIAVRSLRYLVSNILSKHKSVRLVIEIGNHDMASAIWLMEAFNLFYENEPRVFVDTSPRQFHCFTFGKNMIGTHHGHGARMNALPLLFATDWPEQWGSTLHRSIHTGHVHHDQVKQNPGIVVESHGILAPSDAYAANHGYRSKQTMKAIVLHKEHGEVARYTVNPDMLEN
tara:strand:- start:32848 stop:33969 length:1122 start_codon:yes stop_codon:yes gene_type:complete